MQQFAVAKMQPVYGVSTSPLSITSNVDRQHIFDLCRCCCYHNRDVSRHMCLSIDKTIAIPVVSRRLDYYNSLLYYIVRKDFNTCIIVWQG